MQASFVRRSSLSFLILASLTFAACGDREVGASRLKNTHTGMPRDSVLEVIGTGMVAATGADTVRVVAGHHRQMFFIDGRNIEVIWVRETAAGVNDPLTKDLATPVVFADNKLAGWGWKFYAEGGAKLGLKDPMYSNPTGNLPTPAAPASTAPTTTDSTKK